MAGRGLGGQKHPLAREVKAGASTHFNPKADTGTFSLARHCLLFNFPRSKRLRAAQRNSGVIDAACCWKVIGSLAVSLVA
jgi:hypothetical protein